MKKVVPKKKRGYSEPVKKRKEEYSANIPVRFFAEPFLAQN